MRHLHFLAYLPILLAGACAFSPNPDFYSLYPQPTRAATPDSQHPLKVQVRRPGLPGYLERPHIVRRIDAGRIELAGNDRWGSPLEDMVSTTLAKNLAQRLPKSSVFTEGGSISTRADVVVETELQRFELAESGDLELIAQVALHWRDTPERSDLRRYEFAETPASQRTADVVEEMSILLARLSDAIAQSLRERPSAPAPPQREQSADPPPEG